MFFKVRKTLDTINRAQVGSIDNTVAGHVAEKVLMANERGEWEQIRPAYMRIFSALYYQQKKFEDLQAHTHKHNRSPQQV